MNQLREDLDEAVKGQDFEKAADIKSNISQLDAEKKELLETSEPVREEVRTEKVSVLLLYYLRLVLGQII